MLLFILSKYFILRFVRHDSRPHLAIIVSSTEFCVELAEDFLLWFLSSRENTIQLAFFPGVQLLAVLHVVVHI